MQYELYIDLFFLTNFVMDYFVLLTTGSLLACSATHGRRLLGAAFGAFGACLIVILPVSGIAKNIGLYFLVSTGMVCIGLNVRKKYVFARAWLLLYLVSGLYGGVMTWIRGLVGARFRPGILFFAAAIISYYLVSAGMEFLDRLREIRKNLWTVTLYQGEIQVQVKALLDSGNSLRDALTGKPVHIVGNNAIKKLTNNGKIQKVRYIPYHTIQDGESLLPVITIEKMCLQGEREILIEGPVLGISKRSHFGNGSYEMILQPEDCREV